MKLFSSLLAAALAALLVWVFAYNRALDTARQELDQTMLLTTRSVEAEVDRLRAIPDVTAQDARIRRALAGTGSLQDANIYLETVADYAGADVLFLIDASGETIAASNWDTAGSFVGSNYAFRPYFQEAIATGHGDFYAIGVTTGVPGYFIAARVVVNGVTGVLVVKLDLRPLQDTWQAVDADVALADENGIVFLSARADWQYRPLMQLNDAVLADLAATRAYEAVGLHKVRHCYQPRRTALMPRGRAGSRGSRRCLLPAGRSSPLARPRRCRCSRQAGRCWRSLRHW